MNRVVCIATAVLAVTVCLGRADASGPIAVFALVDKVSFEPNADKPERIRISGVFSIAAPGSSGVVFGAPAGLPLFRLAKRQRYHRAPGMDRSEIHCRFATGSGTRLRLVREDAGPRKKVRRAAEVSRRLPHRKRLGQSKPGSAHGQGAAGLPGPLNAHGFPRMGRFEVWNLAVLPQRLHSGGPGRAARCGAVRLAVGAGDRRRSVVERKHHRP